MATKAAYIIEINKKRIQTSGRQDSLLVQGVLVKVSATVGLACNQPPLDAHQLDTLFNSGRLLWAVAFVGQVGPIIAHMFFVHMAPLYLRLLLFTGATFRVSCLVRFTAQPHLFWAHAPFGDLLFSAGVPPHVVAHPKLVGFNSGRVRRWSRSTKDALAMKKFPNRNCPNSSGQEIRKSEVRISENPGRTTLKPGKPKVLKSGIPFQN